MTLSGLNNHLPNIISGALPAVLFIFSISSFAAESDSCTQAKKVFEKNRKEQRSGYKLRRGNWLNCIEDAANDAKRKYCRLKKINDNTFPNVKAEIEGHCSQKGIKRN